MRDHESYSERQTLAGYWPLWLGLVLFLGLVILVAILREPDATTTQAQLEAEIAWDSDKTQEIAALKTHYPADYRTLLEVVAETIDAEGRAAGRREAILFLTSFMRSKQALVVNAPDRELRDVASSLADALNALRAVDEQLCARWVMLGLPPETRLPPEAVTGFSRAAALQIAAARAAERSPRRRRPPSDAEWDAFLAQVAARHPVSGAILQEDRLQTVSPREQCDAGIALYRTAASLPLPLAGSATAELIRPEEEQESR